jgi:hypothetical protein
MNGVRFSLVATGVPVDSSPHEDDNMMKRKRDRVFSVFMILTLSYSKTRTCLISMAFENSLQND